jgi:hypothetical protein
MVHNPLTQNYPRTCATSRSLDRTPLSNLQLYNPPSFNAPPSQPNRSKQSTFAFTTTNNSFSKQVQTPQQRRANEAFAKSEAAKRGKPQTEVERLAEKKKAAKLQAQKSPVSKVWLCKFF